MRDWAGRVGRPIQDRSRRQNLSRPPAIGERLRPAGPDRTCGRVKDERGYKHCDVGGNSRGGRQQPYHAAALGIGGGSLLFDDSTSAKAPETVKELE